jgi:predicted dehydrogenase
MKTIAIVGCGRIAIRHAEILSKSDGLKFKLVAVCDVEEDRAEAFSARYGVPGYRDMHTMMQEKMPDFVAVLTESGNHASHVLNLVQYGRKIIVEKPMALRVEDANKMIEECKNAKIDLFVVKQNRFNPPILKLRQAIIDGRLGKITLGTVRVRWCRTQDYYDADDWRGTWALDGGVLANQAIHHIDMLLWMLGEPVSVFAYSKHALAQIEAEDTAVAVIKFRNGALGVIEATTATRPTDLEGSISVLGTNGTVEVSGFAMNILKTWQISGENGSEMDLNEFSNAPDDVYGFGHSAFYKALDATGHEDLGLVVNGEEGKRSLELLVAIYKSIEEQVEVQLPLGDYDGILGV